MAADKPEKPSCFVIQTFDGGQYDRRYYETVRPALEKADVEPQRADEILGLNPIVEKIQAAIEAASICVAEVSEDNPNVWLELGYALALRRPTVILCEKRVRPRLPFDVQHRPVIFYRTDSRSGYDELDSEIIRWVKHELRTEQRIATAPTLRPGTQGADLEPYDVAILSTAFAFWPTGTGTISHWELEQKLKRQRYTEVGIALGVANLLERAFLVERSVTEEDSNGEEYVSRRYQITPEGIEWLRAHKELLVIQQPSPRLAPEDVDIPF